MQPLTRASSSRFKRWSERFWDLIFPPHCVACGQAGAWLCASCLAQAPRLTPPLCPQCGQPLARGQRCDCTSQPSFLQGIRSVGPHSGALRRAIHALKYQGLRQLAPTLAELMAETWCHQAIPIDQIIPVPLSTARRRTRGYNQSTLLARELAQRLTLPCNQELRRIRDTRSQVGLNPEQRWANVWGAFDCPDQAVANRRILLIDDVLTTGATLQACAATLHHAKAQEVWALTLTRAMAAPRSRALVDRTG